MRDGKVVEAGPAAEILPRARAYTKRPVRRRLRHRGRGGDLEAFSSDADASSRQNRDGGTQ